jgi:hypothetical protein
MNVTTASGSNCTFCDQVVVTLPPAGIKQNDMELSVNLYPNPAKEFITLTISGNITNHVALQILDYTGRTIVNEKINLQPNQNTLMFPVQELKSGVYFLRLYHNENSKTLRFIKQ